MTCRWIILIRGSKYIAAVVSFFEQILQIIALGMVMIHLDDPLRILAYALGYACGSIAGSLIEEKLAIGYTVFQIITQSNSDITEKLRCRGMGVTVWNARGREGEREILLVVVRRKWGSEVLRTVDEIDSKAFVIRHDLQSFKGGFLLKYLETI
jgi:uncharacterized protein YebE (UPF0316 family)